MGVPAFIPSPSANGLHVGPFFFHAYGIAYVFAVLAAVLITRRRTGQPELVNEVAMWGFPAGLIGGRLYFIITTPGQVPDHWWGPFAIWQGGLGIWGGIACGTLAGLWVLRRRGANIPAFLDAAAPGLLVAQAIGRIGNYFNQELFGGPTTLPWGLEIDPAHRPAGYGQYATFHPTFLYELIWNLSLAGFLVWLGRTRRVRAPGLFALYVAGYSAFRMFEETLRIDTSNHVFGLRLNFFVATALCIAGLLWFVAIQRGWRLRRAAGTVGLVWIVVWAAGCGSAAPVRPDERGNADGGGLQLVGGEAGLQTRAPAERVQGDDVVMRLAGRGARTAIAEAPKAVAPGNDLTRNAALL